MLGHPGFSALEYAGSMGNEETKSDMKSKRVFQRRFRRDVAPPAVLVYEEKGPHTVNTEIDSPPLPVEESVICERRRGTFINHTPRNFELPSPRKTETPQTIYDDSHHPYNSYSGSSNRTTNSSSCQPDTQSGDQQLEPNTEVPEEQGSMKTSVRYSFDSKARSSARKDASNSSGGNDGLEKPVYLATSHQVASKATAATESVHHSPLEPLVAQHRDEVTGSDVDPLPPHIDVEHIGQASAFVAIQQYFLGRESLGLPTEIGEGGSQCSHLQKVPPASYKSMPVPSSPAERCAVIFPPESEETVPSLSNRNPKRPNSHRHARPNFTHRDFTSATQGRYSPYDSRHTSLQTRCQHEETCQQEYVKAVVGSVLSAPPIPSHEQLTANRPLDDLNYFLRNTGPSEKREKEKTNFGFRKVRSKKTLATRFGCVEGSPAQDVQSPMPFLPACAREMTTSSGAKHLQIVVPANEIPLNQPFALPIIDSQAVSRRVSITFTEEMLSPLASSDVEKAISGSNRNTNSDDTARSSPTSPRTVLRSPRRPPIFPEVIPVANHPLSITREEQTRTRKLRDLQKSKRKLCAPIVENTVSGAPPTLIESPEPMMSVHGEDNKEGEGNPPNRILRLKRLANEPAQELANKASMDVSDGACDPEEVLEAVRINVAR